MPASVGLCAVRRVGLGAARFSLAAPRGAVAFNCRSLPPVLQRPQSLTLLSSLRTFSSTSLLRSAPSPAPPTPSTPPPPPAQEKKEDSELHESPYTLPNALTVARIIACPFLGYAIVKGDFAMATGILAVSGFTDWLDGYLARKWNQKSVLGSVIDPMADKMLMTTLVVALTYEGLLPLPLAGLIFGRDLCLSLWAFYLRYKSLPPPKTWSRYWDPSMPSAEVRPTQISKVNTALQLLLMGVTTVSPLLSVDIAPALQGLQLVVATTTVWSGLSYVGNSGFKILKQPLKDSIKESLKKKAPPK